MTAIQPRGATRKRRVSQPERKEQEAVKRLLLALGAKFWVAGTVRRKGDWQGTMQTPGLPDIPLCFLPWGGLGCYQLVVIEVKSKAAAQRPGGGLSVEQCEVKRLCEDASVPFIHGDLDTIIDWLIERGYLKQTQVAHYRVRGAAT